MRFKEKIKDVRKKVFDEISIPEYITWWLVRGIMVYSIIMQTSDRERNLAAVISLSLFAIPLLHFLAPRKSMISYLSFRTQTIINIIVFAGSFLGNYICIRNFYSRYDRLLHVISGALCTLIGYYLMEAFCKLKDVHKDMDASVYAIGSAGFSFIVIVLWEIMEFVGDFIWGTNNQGYNIIPSNKDWWYLLCGPGKVTDGAQFPLWDTTMDMTDATILTIITAVIIFAVLRKKEKEKAKLASVEVENNADEKELLAVK